MSGKLRAYRVTFTVVVDVEAHDENEARDRAWDEILDEDLTDLGFIESVEDLGVSHGARTGADDRHAYDACGRWVWTDGR